MPAAVYLQKRDLPGRLRAQGTVQRIERAPDQIWWRLVVDADAAPALAKQLSTETDLAVLALVWHAAVGYVELQAYRGGSLLRRLARDEDGWPVDGSALAWESRLFDAERTCDDDDAPSLEAIRTRRLVPGAREPNIGVEDVIIAARLPTTFEPFTSTSSQTMWRWVAGGAAALLVEALLLPRASWASTAILALTLVVWIAGIRASRATR